jgi:hypothetical protein
MSGKYGDLIKKAREPESHNSGKPENQKASKPDDEPEVNLCIKVPLSLRRHWASEAKRRGVSMTRVIVAALKAEFGELEDKNEK